MHTTFQPGPLRTPQVITTAFVRECFERAGRDVSAVRVRAIVQKCAEVGFDAATYWSAGNCDQQLALDIRVIGAVVTYGFDDLRVITESATRHVHFPAAAAACERLRRMDEYRAGLTRKAAA